MEPNASSSVWLEGGLAALLGLLWAYRLHLRQRPVRPRPDEVEFQRQYEAVEPTSGHPDYVRRSSDLLLALHRWWGKLVLLLVVVAVGIGVVTEPLVRVILGITALVMAAILAVWFRRRRVAGQHGSAIGERGGDSGNNSGPAI